MKLTPLQDTFQSRELRPTRQRCAGGVASKQSALRPWPARGCGPRAAAARARPSHVPARAGVIDGIFQQHFQYWPQYMPLSEIEPGPFTVWLSQLRLPTAPKQSS